MNILQFNRVVLEDPYFQSFIIRGVISIKEKSMIPLLTLKVGVSAERLLRNAVYSANLINARRFCRFWYTRDKSRRVWQQRA